MKTKAELPALKGYRFPRLVVSYAVWVYFRFNMSFRDVEDLLAERGIAVSYETIRVLIYQIREPEKRVWPNRPQ